MEKNIEAKLGRSERRHKHQYKHHQQQQHQQQPRRRRVDDELTLISQIVAYSNVCFRPRKSTVSKGSKAKVSATLTRATCSMRPVIEEEEEEEVRERSLPLLSSSSSSSNDWFMLLMIIQLLLLILSIPITITFGRQLATTTVSYVKSSINHSNLSLYSSHIESLSPSSLLIHNNHQEKRSQSAESLSADLVNDRIGWPTISSNNNEDLDGDLEIFDEQGNIDSDGDNPKGGTTSSTTTNRQQCECTAEYRESIKNSMNNNNVAKITGQIGGNRRSTDNTGSGRGSSNRLINRGNNNNNNKDDEDLPADFSSMILETNSTISNANANPNVNADVNVNVNANDNANISGCQLGNEHGETRIIELPEVIFQWFVYFIFALLFLVGTSTNALTLYSVGRKRTLVPMDIYIIILAINDLIYCLFALPVPPLYILYYGEWVFGNFGCKMVAFLTSFSVHNSSMTVVNIAHLRFRLVVHPFEPKVSTLRACLRTIIACSLSGIITIPYVLVVNLYEDEACGRSCDEYWGHGESGEWKRFLFSLFTTTVQFLLPLIGFEYYYKPIRDKLILLEKTHSNAVISKQAARRHSGGGGGPMQTTTTTTSTSNSTTTYNTTTTIATIAIATATTNTTTTTTSTTPTTSTAATTQVTVANSQTIPTPTPNQNQNQHLTQVNKNQLRHFELSEIKSSSSSISLSLLNLNQSSITNQPTAANSTSSSIVDDQHRNPNNSNNNNKIGAHIYIATTSGTGTSTPNQTTHHQTATSAITNAAANAATNAANANANAAGISSSERERIRQMHLLSRLKQTRKVVYFFSFTWLPLNVFNLVSFWVEPSTIYVYCHLVVQAAACCGVCLNPVIYPLSNDNYRQEFEHILPACLLRKLDSLLKA